MFLMLLVQALCSNDLCESLHSGSIFIDVFCSAVLLV